MKYKDGTEIKVGDLLTCELYPWIGIAKVKSISTYVDLIFSSEADRIALSKGWGKYGDIYKLSDRSLFKQAKSLSVDSIEEIIL